MDEEEEKSGRTVTISIRRSQGKNSQTANREGTAEWVSETERWRKVWSRSKNIRTQIVLGFDHGDL